MDSSKFFITGAAGQLGTALHQKYPKAKTADIKAMNVTKKASVLGYDWSGIDTILNAAAYTNVDGAELPENHDTAFAVNATAVGYLAEVAHQHDIILVHISTDYVFDGTKTPHSEDESFSPLSVYGQSKAAGDQEAVKVLKHYLLRTSWVIGEGKNFVRTMLELGRKGINPSVVTDQVGRPTFTTELVRAIDHLLTTKAPYGTYNVSNDGDPVSWADFTKVIYKEAGLSNTVTNTTTEKYYGDQVYAPRPANSTFDLTKIKASGFSPRDWRQDLKEYIKKEMTK